MKLLWLLFALFTFYVLSMNYGYLLLPGLLNEPPEPWIFQTI